VPFQRTAWVHAFFSAVDDDSCSAYSTLLSPKVSLKAIAAGIIGLEESSPGCKLSFSTAANVAPISSLALVIICRLSSPPVVGH
jgi:hypothetical protein